MTDRKRVFDNGQKRRYDGASGEIYVPEAPRRERGEIFS